MINKNPVIAIVDSGIGGVAVLKSLIKKYNFGNYIYYADNLFMPYGNKTKEQIKQRINEIILNLKENYNVEYIIIACNTASTCINESEYKNVLTMKFDSKHIYLATELTKSNLPKINVISDKTLASQIEDNIFNESELKTIIANCVNKHKLKQFKELVLGCTHYELVDNIFRLIMPNSNIIKNSSFIMENFNLSSEKLETNIVVLMSRQDISLKDKITRLIKLN